MQKLDRYIRFQVFMAIMLVILVLGGLDFIFTVFEELGGTDENYNSVDALRYVMLTLPRHLYEILPISALIGALTGLGVLASNNELVVMQSAGIKIGRIVWSVMKPAMVIMVFGLILGEYIAPPLELRAEVSKAVASGETVALSRGGLWQKNGNQFMHFNAIDPQGLLYGVTVYSYDGNGKLLSNTVAERAVYVEGSTNYWQMENIIETEFIRENGQLNSRKRQLESTRWDVDMSPDLLQVLIVDSDKMAISDLYQFANRFRNQGQDASEFFLAFWKKVLQPLSTAVLVLVAVSFIFGPLRQSSMGARVFIAISIGLTFIILQNLFGTISLVYGISPLFAVLLPLFVIAMAGLYFLRRAS